MWSQCTKVWEVLQYLGERQVIRSNTLWPVQPHPVHTALIPVLSMQVYFHFLLDKYQPRSTLSLNCNSQTQKCNHVETRALNCKALRLKFTCPLRLSQFCQNPSTYMGPINQLTVSLLHFAQGGTSRLLKGMRHAARRVRRSGRRLNAHILVWWIKRCQGAWHLPHRFRTPPSFSEGACSGTSV